MNAKPVIAAAVALAVIGGGAALLYVNRDTAEVASIDNALTAVEEETATAGPEDTAPEEAATSADTTLTDATGTWSVDTTIGTFDFADATSTFAGFRVDEELTTVGQTEAVGRTPAVDGTLTIEGTTLTAATVDADFAQLVSDIPRRDNAMKRAMGVDVNPVGTFTLTQPVDFGTVPAQGDRVTFTAVGGLTVNGMTNPVEVEMEASVADGRILVVGTTPVVFADYGITAPVAGPVVSVEDSGTVELQVWFTRA